MMGAVAAQQTAADELAEGAERVGRQAADSRALEVAARTGFVALGVIYLLIGVIAVRVAFGGGGQADRGGAVGAIAGSSGGAVLLEVLVVGFLGLGLWRLSEAAFGAHTRDGQAATERLKSLAGGVFYGAFGVSTLLLVVGASNRATANDTSESRSATARVMAHPGGRVLIGVVGVVLVVVAGYLVREAVARKFLERLDLATARAGIAKIVTAVGMVGGVARAVVFGLAGVFLVVAAVRYRPADAQGIDGTLRAFTRTPAGPWLLVLVALGLMVFRLFCWGQARYRKV